MSSFELQRKRRRSTSPTSIHKRRNVVRQAKPPYPYTGIIIVAIEQQTDKQVTVPQLFESLRNMFPFFRLEYDGWKNTIRRNLTTLECFERRLDYNNQIKWSVNRTKIPRNAFKLQTGKADDREKWAPTLHEQLKIPQPEQQMEDPCRQSTFDLAIVPSSDATSSLHPSAYIKPDFSFNINDIFSDINLTTVEEADDTRRDDSYDSTPLNICYLPPIRVQTKTPQPSKITHTDKYIELEQLINNRASDLSITSEMAIDNLRMLCDSVVYEHCGDSSNVPDRKDKESHAQIIPSSTLPKCQQDEPECCYLGTESAAIPDLVNISLLS